ncbi:HIT domain-containing protein, partial [Xanthomonas perforans]
TYARAQGLAQDGYRIVMNCREHAGQTVFHLHLHLLAGAPLSWVTRKNAARRERRFCLCTTIAA